MAFVNQLSTYISTDFRTCVPILFAALGLLIMSRSGLTNIGAEGTMLMASLAAVAGSYYSGNVWVGFICAMATGALMGLLFAVLTVTLRSNQIVVGAAFNTLGSGLTVVLNRIIFGITDTTINVQSFSTINVPVLSKIPFIGPILFSQKAPVYLAFLMVPVIHYFLFKMPAGLNLRSVGENPKAADTLGINVYAVRYRASIVGGVLMGMGGAFLSTGLLTFFSEEMTAGRGFIALAAVIFGRYKPVGVMLASMLFAAGTVIANAAQAANSPIPYNFLVMIPYVLTILALAGFAGKTTAPAAAGKPYKRG